MCDAPNELRSFPLPGILAEIEIAADRKAALDIMVSYGGERKSFPKLQSLKNNPGRFRGNWLVKCVGYGTALKIVQHIIPAGGNADIPIGRDFARAERSLIIRDYTDKFSNSKMAAMFGTTERNILRIKAQLRKKGLIT